MRFVTQKMHRSLRGVNHDGLSVPSASPGAMLLPLGPCQRRLQLGCTHYRSACLRAR